VSVLVPAFNHQEYIECCLESIAKSGYAPIEILVIDDGSSDDTYVRAVSWMENHAHKIKRVAIHQQTNQGVVRTLNTLVSMACGEYIALVASDDELEPNGIALRVSALQRHSEWLAVFGDCTMIDATGLQIAASYLESTCHAHFPALVNPRRIARELILRWSVSGPSMLARRSAYDPDVGAGLYDERLVVEDRDFYLRLLSINALGFIPERVARYRLHDLNTVALRNSIVTRDVVAAEWSSTKSFRGLNRCLLTLVAIRGSARLRAECLTEEGNLMRGQMVGLFGKLLAIILRCAYFLHRFLSRPYETRL